MSKRRSRTVKAGPPPSRSGSPWTWVAIGALAAVIILAVTTLRSRPAATDPKPAAADTAMPGRFTPTVENTTPAPGPAPDGMVWIRVEREADICAVIVADQGKGIAHADQERIFEKFERVDPREPGGSGLGLYIARRLARAMGGDVTVDSAPGQGARFVFTLPCQKE